MRTVGDDLLELIQLAGDVRVRYAPIEKDRWEVETYYKGAASGAASETLAYAIHLAKREYATRLGFELPIPETVFPEPSCL